MYLMNIFKGLLKRKPFFIWPPQSGRHKDTKSRRTTKNNNLIRDHSCNSWQKNSVIMIKIAIQKSGRLYEDSIKLLKECGIQLNNGNKQLKAVGYNFPIEVYFLRDDDIPQYIFDGVADVGIVGENVLREKGT